MRFPKANVAWISSIPLVFFMPFINPVFTEPWRYIENLSMFAVCIPPVLFSYGIATSKFSEYISYRSRFKYKKFLSLILHLLFGLLFIFPYSIFVYSSIFTEGVFNFATTGGIVCAFVFFLVNEIVMKYYNHQG